MLKGQAKKDYQREYMRRRRANVRPVRPPVLDPVQPAAKIDGIIMKGNRIVGVQPKKVVQPKTVIPGPLYPARKKYHELTPEEKGVTSYDADGYPIYE